MIFKRIFGAEKAAKAKITEALYDQIVAAARQPVFYAEWGVPDTPLGRYEMISLHLFLVLHRLKGQSGALSEIAQELTDMFFTDLDHSIRELGIGDLGVPKRMKKLARMFYGRAASYGEAIDYSDLGKLSEALARNVRPQEANWAGAGELGAYVLNTYRRIAGTPLADIAAGKLDFAPVATMPGENSHA